MEVQYRGSGKIFFKDKEYRCYLYYNEKLGGVLINTPLYNFIHDNQMTKALISEPSQEYLILL